ncbi:hypothetical protein AUW17_04670 [Tenacibaculum dicentrarchi]|nr:hypothetical protein AUW17_04670 [Tenacibaculum dicentrarchi]
MELFPAFRTRFFYFFEEKKQKRAQTIASIGARIKCYIPVYYRNANKRHAEFISASHQQKNYDKSGCEPKIKSYKKSLSFLIGF